MEYQMHFIAVETFYFKYLHKKSINRIMFIYQELSQLITSLTF